MGYDIHNFFPDFRKMVSCHMRGFRSCSADVSDYVTIDDTTEESPIVTGVSRKFPGNIAGSVTYKLFRSYSTECALFAATRFHNFLFVRDGYTTTTNTQLGKFARMLLEEQGALVRVNLYQASYTVKGYGGYERHTTDGRLPRFIDAVFASVPQDAISKQSDETTLVIKRSKFPLVSANNYACLFVPSMRRALSPIPRLLYGVDIDRYFDTE